MTEKKLLGGPLAARIIEAAKVESIEHSEMGWKPNLVSITIGDTGAVDVYVRNQKRIADRSEVGFEERHFSANVTQDELKVIIRQMNTNPSVTGIIIQRPVPEHLNVKALQTYIHPLKDVEGMHPASIGNIVYNELDMAPCTAAAAVELLHESGVKMKGLEVVMVGHSAIVGKPAAFMMMAEGATVTICHHMTKDLGFHTKRADAVLVAAGVPGLITGDMIKEGAIIVDVGINIVKDENGKDMVVGDVDYATVEPIASKVTPVPGGVGPVTVAILMRNTITALKRQRRTYTNKYGSDN